MTTNLPISIEGYVQTLIGAFDTITPDAIGDVRAQLHALKAARDAPISAAMAALLLPLLDQLEGSLAYQNADASELNKVARVFATTERVSAIPDLVIEIANAIVPMTERELQTVQFAAEHAILHNPEYVHKFVLWSVATGAKVLAAQKMADGIVVDETISRAVDEASTVALSAPMGDLSPEDERVRKSLGISREAWAKANTPEPELSNPEDERVRKSLGLSASAWEKANAPEPELSSPEDERVRKRLGLSTSVWEKANAPEPELSSPEDERVRKRLGISTDAWEKANK